MPDRMSDRVSEHMPERMSDRMSEYIYNYLYIRHIHFQMVCQKLCQTCLSGFLITGRKYFFEDVNWMMFSQDFYVSNFPFSIFRVAIQNFRTTWETMRNPSVVEPRNRWFTSFFSLTFGSWMGIFHFWKDPHGYFINITTKMHEHATTGHLCVPFFKLQFSRWSRGRLATAVSPRFCDLCGGKFFPHSLPHHRKSCQKKAGVARGCK